MAFLTLRSRSSFLKPFLPLFRVKGLTSRIKLLVESKYNISTMSEELSGKVSIITGASSGLGQATAILFAKKGAKVVLCGRDEDRLKKVMDQCTQASGGHGDRFITVQGDITDARVRDDIVAKTIEQFGCLNVLVASAGVLLPGMSITEASEETFDTIMNVNVKSIFFLIQKALPHLEKTKGNIVSLSSTVSTMVSVPGILYPMSKAVIDHMTRCLAVDLGPKGIRVNAVKPSLIPTRMRRHYPGTLDEIYEKALESESQNQPLGYCGSPDDVAESISFLASDAAKFITGECLSVDGGRALVGPNLSKAPKK